MTNSILDLPFILETRTNHALEHATLHVLAEKHPTRSMAGHSNPTGFFILGDLSNRRCSICRAQALTRLRGGESDLAIHAGCGTNIATTDATPPGLLPGSLCEEAKSTFGRIIRIPFAIVFALLGALDQSSAWTDHPTKDNDRCRDGQSANRGRASILGADVSPRIV